MNKFCLVFNISYPIKSESQGLKQVTISFPTSSKATSHSCDRVFSINCLLLCIPADISTWIRLWTEPISAIHPDRISNVCTTSKDTNVQNIIECMNEYLSYVIPMIKCLHCIFPLLFSAEDGISTTYLDIQTTYRKRYIDQKVVSLCRLHKRTL